MAKRDPKLFPHKVGDDYYSDKKVLESAAGFYIGTTMWDENMGFEQHGTRESNYFPNQALAQAALDSGNFEVRQCDENDWAYDNGLPRPAKKAESKEKNS